MAEHTRCSACHRKNNPDFPTAPKLFTSCWNCHAKNPTVPSIKWEGRKLSLSVAASGPETTNISDLSGFFRESFTNAGFDLSDENTAEISLTFQFEVREVFDSELLPERFKICLFQGECKIEISSSGKKVSETMIISKARSGMEPSDIVRTVLHYLKFRANDAAFIGLSKIPVKPSEK